MDIPVRTAHGDDDAGAANSLGGISSPAEPVRLGPWVLWGEAHAAQNPTLDLIRDRLLPGHPRLEKMASYRQLKGTEIVKVPASGCHARLDPQCMTPSCYEVC